MVDVNRQLGELLQGIKRAMNPTEADSARVLDALQGRWGDLEADVSAVVTAPGGIAFDDQPPRAEAVRVRSK